MLQHSAKRAVVILYDDEDNLSALASAVDLEDILRLRQALILDVADQLSAGRVEVSINVHSSTATPSFGEYSITDDSSSPGRARSLTKVMIERFSRGFGAVCIVDPAYPAVPHAFIEHAFEALDEPLSVVLGPGEGGGCYLVAGNDLFIGLLDGIAITGYDALPTLLTRAGEMARSVTILPELPSFNRASEPTASALQTARVRTAEVLQDMSVRYPSLL